MDRAAALFVVIFILYKSAFFIVIFRLSNRKLAIKEQSDKIENFENELDKFSQWIAASDAKLSR